MNIFEKYKVDLYDNKEFIKLDKYITIGSTEDGFYFKNPKNINNDFGYSALLELDVRAYRRLMYSGTKYKEHINKTTFLYENQKEARRKKKLLLILLLDKYKTLNEIEIKMNYLLSK